MLSTWPVVLVCGDPEETSVIEGILNEHMVLMCVQDLPEMKEALGDGAYYDVVLCGWSFQNGTWKDVVKHVGRRCADLPVIIFSRTGSEREWAEVLEAGAFELLTAPYLERILLAAIEHAVRSNQAGRPRQDSQPRPSQKQTGKLLAWPWGMPRSKGQPRGRPRTP